MFLGHSVCVQIQALIIQLRHQQISLVLNHRGVRLAKNDFGTVFGLVLRKTAVFVGSVSVLQN